MSQLTLLLLQIGFLILLWAFVFAVVYSLRADLFGVKVRKLPDPAPAAAPAAATADVTAPVAPVAGAAASASAATATLGRAAISRWTCCRPARSSMSRWASTWSRTAS